MAGMRFSAGEWRERGMLPKEIHGKSVDWDSDRRGECDATSTRECSLKKSHKQRSFSSAPRR